MIRTIKENHDYCGDLYFLYVSICKPDGLFKIVMISSLNLVKKKEKEIEQLGLI